MEEEHKQEQTGHPESGTDDGGEKKTVIADTDTEAESGNTAANNEKTGTTSGLSTKDIAWIGAAVIVVAAGVWFILPKNKNPEDTPAISVHEQTVPAHAATQSTGEGGPTVRETVDLAELSVPKPAGFTWWDPTNIRFDGSKLTITLGATFNASSLSMSLDNNDSYGINFYLGGENIAGVQLDPKPLPDGGLNVHTVTVPDEAVKRGYNKLGFTGSGGDDVYILGHVTLTP